VTPIRRTLKSLAAVIAVLAGIGAVVYLFGGTFYSKYPTSYLAIQRIVSAIEPLQRIMAEAALEAHSTAGIGKLVHAPKAIPTKYGDADLSVSDDGEISVRHDALRFTVRFTPRLDGAALTWSCSGRPEHDVPPDCRH
jgi:hypothetical protein